MVVAAMPCWLLPNAGLAAHTPAASPQPSAQHSARSPQCVRGHVFGCRQGLRHLGQCSGVMDRQIRKHWWPGLAALERGHHERLLVSASSHQAVWAGCCNWWAGSLAERAPRRCPPQGRNRRSPDRTRRWDRAHVVPPLGVPRRELAPRRRLPGAEWGPAALLPTRQPAWLGCWVPASAASPQRAVARRWPWLWTWEPSQELSGQGRPRCSYSACLLRRHLLDPGWGTEQSSRRLLRHADAAGPSGWRGAWSMPQRPCRTRLFGLRGWALLGRAVALRASPFLPASVCGATACLRQSILAKKSLWG